MTDILLSLIVIVLSVIAVLTYKIYKHEPQDLEINTITQAGVTPGSYAPTYTTDNGTPVGISEAKTPQLIEWEAEQELLKKNQSLGR